MIAWGRDRDEEEEDKGEGKGGVKGEDEEKEEQEEEEANERMRSSETGCGNPVCFQRWASSERRQVAARGVNRTLMSSCTTEKVSSSITGTNVAVR